jgi:3-deoxy-D-manno-octulosonate 8-phosphate phosphatase (KDO 8-P phosphatase)
MRNLDLAAKAKKIKLVAFDVDGVMTDGSLTFGEDGREFKTYNAKDGQGIVMLNRAGFKTAIITARENQTVNVRAKILNITKLHHGIKDKFLALQDLMKEFNLSYEEIAYMGDDLPDICVLKHVGLSACPNDAVDEVQEVCGFVSKKNGGRGAVREFCNFILAVHGISWDDLTRCK